MYPPHEHAFYIWCIAIAAVGVATFLGAVINRMFLNRQLRRVRCMVASKRYVNARGEEVSRYQK